MRKILYCFLIIAMALIVISCSNKDDLAFINPGLYEIKFDAKQEGQLIMLKQRVRYKSDGTYEATNFQNDIAVEELKGKYKVENNQLVSYDNQHRLVTQEGKWAQKDMSKVEVRKIRQKSYQYYFNFPNDQLREQYKRFGLSEGWKTYKRISD